MSRETEPLLQKPEDIYRERLRESGISLSLITFCLCTGSFLASADGSIVTTIFTEIGSEFKSSSALQPLYSKLSDMYGRKTILIVVNTFFFVGSAACGAAQNMVQLAIARVIAGIGGGGLMCMASVVIHDLVPVRERGKYQSYVNMTQTIGTAMGAPLGGMINDMIGWRTCFYINLPPGLFALYIYYKRLPNYNDRTKGSLLEQIDILGACILFVANACFVLGMSSGGNTREWNDPWVVTILAVAATAYITFITYQLRWSRCPMLAPKMGILGYNTSSAGLWTMPRTIAIALGCWCVGRYIGVTGRYKNYLIAVMVLIIFSNLGMVLWTPTREIASKMTCMLVDGFGNGGIVVGTMVALVADISHEDTASATSMIFLFRSTGLVTGSATSAAIVQASFKSILEKTITGPDAKSIIDFVRSSINEVNTLDPEIQRSINSVLCTVADPSAPGAGAGFGPRMTYTVAASPNTEAAILEIPKRGA
ncbi:major facilitator superfamily domain-containing protein [Fennellomyces sp. T-0311]|nr:major facilitator superfamily domain-containing protein [Fennellomyces sp. T-0311]